jgi:CRISPR/Cas system CSM-associated protein Csm3 (group 7 of RAMP superfamily)
MSILGGKNTRSQIYFYDAVVDDETARYIQRIHINKLSGGVMDKALFSEMPVSGKATIRISINKWNTKEQEQNLATLGLMLYAVRDLAIGAFSLGGNSSVGRGFVRVNCIEIADDGVKKSKLVLSNGSDITVQTEGEAFVQEALQAIESIRSEEQKREDL